MSTNTLKSFCELVENSPRNLGGALREGTKNLVAGAGENINKLCRYYKSNGFWITFGMLSAHFFMFCVLAFFYAIFTGLFLAMLSLGFGFSWITILAANLLTLAAAAALSWGGEQQ